MNRQSNAAIDAFVTAVTAALGDMDSRETAAVQAAVRGAAARVLDIENLPATVARNLAPTLTTGMPLAALVQANLEAGDHSEEAFAPLFTVADVVDSLAISRRPLVGCPASIWQVDESERLCPPGPRLEVWRADPGIGRLTEYQQAAGSGRIHRGLQRGLEGIDLAAASFHAFAILLVELLLGRTAPTTAELLDSMRKMPPDRVPSSLLALLAAAIEAPVKERPQASCRDLLSRALKALRVNVFRLRPVANTSGGHEAFGYSVQGLHKPGRNEDRWGDWRHGPGSLLVVADGVSTADLGSGSMAAEEIVQLIDTTSFGAPMFANVVDRCVADGRGWPDRAREYLDELLRRAHARIVKRTNMLARERGGAVRPAKDPMSSTATVAFVLGDQAVIGWVGDSPAWIFSPDRGLFNRVTASQNVGREREFSFDATAGASALTQAVGGCDFSSAERKYVAAPLEPEFVTVQLAVGDVLILGSDGAVDGIGEAAPQDNEARFAAEVRRLCAEKKPLNRIVRDLIDPAESGAGHDNITLVVLRVTPGKEDHGRRDHSLLRAQP